MILIKIVTNLLLIIFLTSCSSSYKKLSKLEFKQPKNFQQFILSEYKTKAIFEFEEMYDINSAKLYSDKALKSLETDQIYPENISYWKIPKDKISELKIAHENLLLIYDEAKILDPYNLARAIVSLDCWAEQKEEAWQTWDIQKCKDNFLNSIHIIYNKIRNEEIGKNKRKANKNLIIKDKATIVTKSNNNQIMQIIYFDFDDKNLSNISKNSIKNFLDKYNSEIDKFLIIGHTDTKGDKKYNLNLSIQRAKVVKELLIESGISDSKIKIVGKGEESLAIITPDNTKHPANRRVEIKKSN